MPTPFRDGHQPDLSYVQAAALSLALVLKAGDLVILESTSPVGATEQIAGWLVGARPDLTFPQQAGEVADINIAYCPERVLSGKVMVELIKNDRVVGGMTPRCSARAADLYRIFLEGECVMTIARTAEMCKLTENIFHNTNIAFANKLSIICAEQQINVWELITLANRHPRVNILQLGLGVGGHCIVIDPWFIIAQNPSVANCLTDSGCGISDITIACFGLTFKADIDDLFESPALHVTRMIACWHRGQTLAVEPNVGTVPASLDGLVTLVNWDQMLVDHRQFRAIDSSVIRQRWIVDTSGVWQ